MDDKVNGTQIDPKDEFLFREIDYSKAKPNRFAGKNWRVKVNRAVKLTEADAIRYVTCRDNTAYPIAFERKKLYPVLPDERAEQSGLLRVIDELGEDYLYPKTMFVEVPFEQQDIQRLRLTL